jgi:amino acid transporter
MRRRNDGPAGSQPESQDVERSSSATGSGTYTTSSSGATGSTMQEQGGTYQQSGPPQQGGYQQSGARAGSQGTAPAPQGGYGTSGSGYYDRQPISRHGGGLAILAGSLAFLEGLAFVIRGHYFHYTVGGYAYSWNLHGWGWTLLILGAILFAGGVSTLLGLRGSREVAGGIAVILAVVAFITIFYSFIWGVVVLAASGFAASSLLMHRSDYVAGGRQVYPQQVYPQQGYPPQGYQGDDTMAGQGQGSRHRF